MPLAWEVVAVQFGYIGLRLWERFGKVGLLMIALLGAINIPFYEEMAQRIGSSRETVTRLLSELKKKRLIRLEGATLVIRNRTGLEALAL